MLKIDQFESAFRSAAKTRFDLEPVELSRALIVSDLSEDEAPAYEERVRTFAEALGDLEWHTARAGAYDSVQSLFSIVELQQPHLICTYRNLGSEAWRLPFSLGTTVDVLTQASPVPVLLLPHPHAGREAEHAMEDTDSVMIVTDHLTGDNRLVSWAVRFTGDHGTLHLTHIEDEDVFARYVGVIDKLPGIDTDDARERIRRQLLKEPREFMDTVRESLEAAKIEIAIEGVVRMGHELEQYRSLVSEHEVDLLVFNTKDERQLGMNGLAYALATELRSIPLLML